MSIIKSIKSKTEDFTGIKPTLIEQDINSTIYVSNLAEDIICDIEEEDKEHLKNDYKHTMQINRSLSIGLLKSDSIYILIETDENRKSELLQALYDEIRVNVVPIRPDRHYHRTKGQVLLDKELDLNLKLMTLHKHWVYLSKLFIIGNNLLQSTVSPHTYPTVSITSFSLIPSLSTQIRQETDSVVNSVVTPLGAYHGRTDL